MICNGKATEGEILPTLFLQMSSFLRPSHSVVTKGKLSSKSQNYHFTENHHHLLQKSNKVHLARNFCLGLSRNLISLSSGRCVQEQLLCDSSCSVSKIGERKKAKLSKILWSLPRLKDWKRRRKKLSKILSSPRLKDWREKSKTF